MHANDAAILRDAYAGHLAAEHKATAAVIAAVPDDKGSYAPDPKCMTALDLAWHIASSEVWFINSSADGAFVFGDPSRPAGITSASAVSAWYAQEFPKALDRVKACSGDHMAKEASFAVWTQPVVDTLGLAVRHSIHHRGQLSAYLRPMGAKVPSIYGPSADVTMEMLTGAAHA